jgi:hypothetical protein
MIKRTYVLPPGTLKEFERIVGAGERSGVIARLLQEWLETLGREQLRHAVIEGCRDMADVYREVECEYHPLEEEVGRSTERILARS